MLDLSPRAHYRWARMLTPGDPAECWPWSGRLDDKGYGFIKVYGRTTRVHRVAWALAHDRWPSPRRVVRHTCDNPPCCNPAHLILGTVADNVHDCVRRGRRARGESLRQSRLTEADVRVIRRRAETGERYRSIAQDYPVGAAAIGQIARRVNWSHVV